MLILERYEEQVLAKVVAEFALHRDLMAERSCTRSSASEMLAKNNAKTTKSKKDFIKETEKKKEKKEKKETKG